MAYAHLAVSASRVLDSRMSETVVTTSSCSCVRLKSFVTAWDVTGEVEAGRTRAQGGAARAAPDHGACLPTEVRLAGRATSAVVLLTCAVSGGPCTLALGAARAAGLRAFLYGLSTTGSSTTGQSVVSGRHSGRFRAQGDVASHHCECVSSH